MENKALVGGILGCVFFFSRFSGAVEEKRPSMTELQRQHKHLDHEEINCASDNKNGPSTYPGRLPHLVCLSVGF